MYQSKLTITDILNAFITNAVYFPYTLNSSLSRWGFNSPFDGVLTLNLVKVKQDLTNRALQGTLIYNCERKNEPIKLLFT